MSTDSPRAPIEWHPVLLLQREPTVQHFALVVVNQPLNDISTLQRLWNNSCLHVAADGGANRLYDVDQRILADRKDHPGAGPSAFADLHTIIGDLDSLKPSVRSYFEAANHSLEVLHVPDQDSTDFTKAVRHVRASSDGRPIDIVTMGGLGGRVDQGLSQLHHLYMFQRSPTYAEGRFYLVSGESLTFLLKAGHHRIHVREAGMRHAQEDVFDKYAGIIPIKEPSVITLKGFEWDVQEWPTELGGQVSTSNHVLPESDVVEVTTNKDVLFTIALHSQGGKE